MSLIVAKSIDDAIPAILTVLGKEATAEVWLPPLLCGYWAELKTGKPVVTDLDVRREYRRLTKPQPYDVQLIAWPAWMYRGFHAGHRSSAL